MQISLLYTSVTVFYMYQSYTSAAHVIDKYHFIILTIVFVYYSSWSYNVNLVLNYSNKFTNSNFLLEVCNLTGYKIVNIDY